MPGKSSNAYPPEMDKGNRAFYEAAFERDFLRKRGNAFAEFFANLMGKRCPDGDFIRVRQRYCSLLSFRYVTTDDR